MTTRRAILAVHWTHEKAQVRVRDDGAPKSRLIDPLGLRLNYQVAEDAKRWCVGHTSQTAGYVDCATVLSEDDGRTCSRCAAAEAIFASQLHHAHNQPRRSTDSDMGRHLEQENILYLAAFRDGSIKVGTSTAARSQKRLLEQGAWQAVKVATAADGYAVREIEDRITEDLGVPQAVLGGRKLSGLAEPLTDERLHTEVVMQARAVSALIDEAKDERLTPLGEPWSNPAAQLPVWNEVRRYPLTPGRGRHDLVLEAIVGRMVAARRPGTDDVFVVDLAKLYGLEIELGNFASDEIVIQESLF